MTSRSRYSRTEPTSSADGRAVVHGVRPGLGPSPGAPAGLAVSERSGSPRARGSTSSSRSHSCSATRRPSAASSTERTSPLRCENVCISQITPHLSVPNTSQKRRWSGSTVRPDAVGVDRQQLLGGAEAAGALRRRCRTATTSRRTSRGPRPGRRGGRAPSRARTRRPSGPTMKLPVRKSPWTSAGSVAGRSGARSVEPAHAELERRVWLAEQVDDPAELVDQCHGVLACEAREVVERDGVDRGGRPRALRHHHGTRPAVYGSSRSSLRGIVSPSMRSMTKPAPRSSSTSRRNDTAGTATPARPGGAHQLVLGGPVGGADRRARVPPQDQPVDGAVGVDGVERPGLARRAAGQAGEARRRR